MLGLVMVPAWIPKDLLYPSSQQQQSRLAANCVLDVGDVTVTQCCAAAAATEL